MDFKKDVPDFHMKLTRSSEAMLRSPSMVHAYNFFAERHSLSYFVPLTSVAMEKTALYSRTIDNNPCCFLKHHRSYALKIGLKVIISGDITAMISLLTE
ncbi:hypothetical protein RB195_009809 [Necator americanus]|uniref:Uncharacterized protein n=1 Tax=Necator americanus TaxID=51031 RepID=A0ABR1CYC4_NECAM